MQVPSVNSVVKVRVKFTQGPMMIPPQPSHILFEGTVLPSYRWLNDREFCLSGDKDWPIRVMNMDMIENIDLVSGEFKEVNTDVKTFTVDGSKGSKYVVTRNKQGWKCTCPGFGFRGQCKHISEFKNTESHVKS